MMEVHVQAGEHIDNAIKALVHAAQTHGAAKATFNGVELVADPAATASALLSEWSRKQEEAAFAYRNSPEGKAAEAKREASIQSAQETHDRLVQDLATLNFKNDVAVLDWICAIQDSTDHVGVAVNKAAIADAFAAAGLASPCLTIVGEVVRLHETLDWYAAPPRRSACGRWSRKICAWRG